jgi:hypothetical protein
LDVVEVFIGRIYNQRSNLLHRFVVDVLAPETLIDLRDIKGRDRE